MAYVNGYLAPMALDLSGIDYDIISTLEFLSWPHKETRELEREAADLLDNQEMKSEEKARIFF